LTSICNLAKSSLEIRTFHRLVGRFNAMIARLWWGWTTSDNADAYQQLLRTEILPEIQTIAGCQGAYLLRRDVEGDVEFVVLTQWQSMDAVRRFAGEGPEVAVVSPAARALLSRFDETVKHYETVLQPD
jgi:heme-degrading monooxygenase HmoA